LALYSHDIAQGERNSKHRPRFQNQGSTVRVKTDIFRIDNNLPKMCSMPRLWACLGWAAKSSIRWTTKIALPTVLMCFASIAADAQPILGQTNLKALFAEVGRSHNIDPDLLEAMAEVESGGDVRSVSPKGALGLMQLMPATASTFSVLDPFDPVANLTGAADFLDYLRSRLANNLNLHGWPALLAAYNAGPGAVEKYGGIPPYPETHEYVRRVIQRYANSLSARPVIAPVLILGPKPYIIQLRPGSSAAEPEPVLINAEGDNSPVNRLVTIQGVHGPFVAAMGTGTAPWIRHAALHNRSDLPQR
jgi:hypothetical protein